MHIRACELVAKGLGCAVSTKAPNILKAVARNDGYCPCVPEDKRDPAEDYQCPCSLLEKQIEEKGQCCCQLFTTF